MSTLRSTSDNVAIRFGYNTVIALYPSPCDWYNVGYYWPWSRDGSELLCPTRGMVERSSVYSDALFPGRIVMQKGPFEPYARDDSVPLWFVPCTRVKVYLWALSLRDHSRLATMFMYVWEKGSPMCFWHDGDFIVWWSYLCTRTIWFILWCIDYWLANHIIC